MKMQYNGKPSKVRFQGMREVFERVFGGVVRPPRRPRKELIKGRKPHPRARPLKEVAGPTITHDDLLEYMKDAGFIDPDLPELSPELIRILPDRAQGAYQSAAQWAHHGKLVQYLCTSLAYALRARDRYKMELAEAMVEMLELTDRLNAMEGVQKMRKDLEEVLPRPGSKPDPAEIRWEEEEIRFTGRADPCDACTVEKGIHQGCPPDCEVLKEIDGV